jgi:predicted HicB family RNase H-like nuclease
MYGTEIGVTSFVILEHLERPGESRQKFAGQLNLRVEEV